EPEDPRRLLLGVGRALRELHAAGLAAPAGEHLRLDHDRPAELLGRGACLLRRRRQPAVRDGDAEPAEGLLALILVEVHGRAGLYRCAPGARRACACTFEPTGARETDSIRSSTHHRRQQWQTSGRPRLPRTRSGARSSMRMHSRTTTGPTTLTARTA